MIDRGFIKWQPFNSVISNKVILNNSKQKRLLKPELFPEEIAIINENLINAYYDKSIVTIIYFENNLFKKIKTIIKEINPTYKTIKLGNGKTIAFNQIIKLF